MEISDTPRHAKCQTGELTVVPHGINRGTCDECGCPNGLSYTQAEVNDMIACAVRAERERIAAYARFNLRGYVGRDRLDMMLDDIVAPAVSATKPATGERETGATLKGLAGKN